MVTIKVDTLPETITPSSPSGGAARPDGAAGSEDAAPGGAGWARSWKWWTAWSLFVGLVLAASGVMVWAGVTTVGYDVYKPGDATPTEPLISASGVKLFPAEGEVLYLTVRSHRMSRLEKFRYDHDLFWPANSTIQAAPPNVSSSQQQTRDIAVMARSKDTASYMALRALGYEPKVTGSGLVIDKPDTGNGEVLSEPLKPGDVVVGLETDRYDNLGPDVILIRLQENLSRRAAGDIVEVHLLRDGSPITVKVTLSTSADGRVIVGFKPAGPPVTTAFTMPVALTIDTGDVGGPSAGLALTLGAIDVLTPGELTGGAKVAVTGRIDFFGRIGAIGHADKKALAARDGGATVFLVPVDDVEEAKSRLRDNKMKVIGVATLNDALAELAKLGGNALALPKIGKAA
jgi:Lon-like protease